jgi:hypothetical protein
MSRLASVNEYSISFPGEVILKKLVLLIALFVTADIAAAAPHDKEAEVAAVAPSGHPSSIPADTQLINSGKVLDVIDSDMYTYVQVTHEQGPLWIAGYKTDISKGATVSYSGGIAMTDFHSKSLNRSFDLIVFVDSLEQVKK